MAIINSNSTCLINIYDDTGKLTDLGTEYYKVGNTALSQNKFGVVILSGGQGTRLGCSGPKGLFKICDKSLFEHHIDKIKKLKYSQNVRLFIMTSDHTDEDVVSYFKSNNNFNLDVVFFKQNSLPCTYKDGSVIKIEDHKVLTAPNGNGDFFKSISKFDLSDLYAINVISVDNVLAEILNPEFVGAFIKSKVDCLSKSVTKLPDENVGIFIKNSGKLEIKEYSEIDKDQEEACEGNICNHLFKTEFVKMMGLKDLPIHKACKNIPNDIRKAIDRPNETKCLKSELFIFDCFAFTDKNKIFSVPRWKEFAPLKNGMKSEKDNPETCAQAYRKKYNKEY
ncbi:udp-n-acetylglucosamine pyrophosphorylase [Vairimorpha ceranae]|uniref:UDP-N-acetylglucosamine diphosphorylase n=1 Tax=Vairimorpha ceranae TaxID=40302 RepID=A0A0F9WEN0_9MICR|nr:udp-n-acetylglucosamine pyrophosphorylase [Vairimorpha ceranae]KKO75836.1 udp-n-acetylglucosamine pyrophosphorylase [Vairimorpha ceranae]